ncbi:alpha/beta fold hydrolase [Conexibacter sp. CPCC 206217]|uniref:alpha/beta fold hydrolase n=1 Tax=Conexibacter sp. CPCC 206217 TaxID=3064574 RepID=UPI002728325B|nr:alpha/beta hydrolase [Conexibacter sp. CPCC 206217]MDO8212057.1 alpha/beta hydrolase [Conexibacter sp. CPCC 206217]
MSDLVNESTLLVDGREVRYLHRGEGPELLLLLHTGAPGQSPFAGSCDLFADLVRQLRPGERRIVAPDLPGCGATALHGVADLTTDGIVHFVKQFVASLRGVEKIHVVGHGDASLAALALIRDGIGGTEVSSGFLIAPNAAAPIGDSIQNVSLLNPPQPRWTLRSQRWAIRRLTYVPDRFPRPLLERLVDNADGAPHRRAVELLADPVNASAMLAAQIAAQDEFYAYCRDERYRQPLTIFWGAADPTATVARGAVLAQILAGGPAGLDFQLVNQCGHFAQFDREFQLARLLEATLDRALVA